MAKLGRVFFAETAAAVLAILLLVSSLFLLVEGVEAWTSGAHLRIGPALHFVRPLLPIETAVAVVASRTAWAHSGRLQALSVSGHAHRALALPAAMASAAVAVLVLAMGEGISPEGWMQAGSVVRTPSHAFVVEAGLVEPVHGLTGQFHALPGPNAPLWVLLSSLSSPPALAWTAQRALLVVHAGLLGGMAIGVAPIRGSGVFVPAVAVGVVLSDAAFTRGVTLGTTPLPTLLLPGACLAVVWAWVARRESTDDDPYSS